MSKRTVRVRAMSVRFADKMNGMPKYVVLSTLGEAGQTLIARYGPRAGGRPVKLRWWP
jgi:hypothetical protein